MATGDLDKTLIAAIGLRLDSEDTGQKLRRLTNRQIPPAATMTRVQARHVKAALLHSRAEDIARQAGVDLARAALVLSTRRRPPAGVTMSQTGPGR